MFSERKRTQREKNQRGHLDVLPQHWNLGIILRTRVNEIKSVWWTRYKDNEFHSEPIMFHAMRGLKYFGRICHLKMTELSNRNEVFLLGREGLEKEVIGKSVY